VCWSSVIEPLHAVSLPRKTWTTGIGTEPQCRLQLYHDLQAPRRWRGLLRGDFATPLKAGRKFDEAQRVARAPFSDSEIRIPVETLSGFNLYLTTLSARQMTRLLFWPSQRLIHGAGVNRPRRLPMLNRHLSLRGAIPLPRKQLRCHL
jgi:hypothetical protein